MSKIKFENRAVAFIDILGFSKIVENAVNEPESLEKLSDLIKLLELAVPKFDEEVGKTVSSHLIPRHIYISDSIILSAPLVDKEQTNYCGLSTIVMRCIQLTHYFLEQGYLIRGGIDIGNVWHGESNIVGPAYQNAYILETQAQYPRVILSEKAQNKPHWLCTKYEDQVMVDGLHDYFIPNGGCSNVIDKTYDKYKKIVGSQLSSSLSPEVEKKWKWFDNYLDETRRSMASPN